MLTRSERQHIACGPNEQLLRRPCDDLSETQYVATNVPRVAGTHEVVCRATVAPKIIPISQDIATCGITSYVLEDNLCLL